MRIPTMKIKRNTYSSEERYLISNVLKSEDVEDSLRVIGLVMMTLDREVLSSLFSEVLSHLTVGNSISMEDEVEV